MQKVIKSNEAWMKLIEEEINVRNDNVLILALVGELGAGKTTFTQSLGKVLGIKDNVISPTFIVHREYKIDDKRFLHHLDLYRLKDNKELTEILTDNLFRPGNVIVIEWADKFKPEIVELAKKHESDLVWIHFEHINETSRKVTIKK